MTLWMGIALAEAPFALVGLLIVGYMAFVFLEDACMRLRNYWSVWWQMDYRPNRIKRRGKNARPWQNML